MIEHSIEWINSVEHFCGHFLLEGGRGGASQSYWLSNNPNYWICWQRFWKIQLSIWSLGVLSTYTNHPIDNFVYENSNIQITSIIVKHRPAANWSRSVQDAKESKRHSLSLQDNSLMLSESLPKIIAERIWFLVFPTHQHSSFPVLTPSPTSWCFSLCQKNQGQRIALSCLLMTSWCMMKFINSLRGLYVTLFAMKSTNFLHINWILFPKRMNQFCYLKLTM